MVQFILVMPFLKETYISVKSLAGRNDTLRSIYLWIYQVGTKVAAVSRKTNTTTHEILGVLTKGNTQIVCHFIKFIYSCAGSLVGNETTSSTIDLSIYNFLEFFLILLGRFLFAVNWILDTCCLKWYMKLVVFYFCYARY